MASVTLRLEDLVKEEVDARVDTAFTELAQLRLKQEEKATIMKNELAQERQKNMKELENEREKLTKRSNELREFQVVLEMRERAINNAVKDCETEKIIEINAGGKYISTRASTLVNVSPYFANLFSDKWAKTENTSNIFIDYPDYYFEDFLNWARFGGKPKKLLQIINKYENLNYGDVEEMKDMLIYFGVDVPYTTAIYKGQRITVWWLSGGGVEGTNANSKPRAYNGYVISDITDLPSVKIRYNDGETWEYNLDKLLHKTGPNSDKHIPSTDYMDEKLEKDIIKYSHYGFKWGSNMLANCDNTSKIVKESNSSENHSDGSHSSDNFASEYDAFANEDT